MGTACAPGGPVEELLKLRDEGVIGAVGFSTHAPLEVICAEVLRFRRLWKCYDLETFGFYRYNPLEANGHWFPGG